MNLHGLHAYLVASCEDLTCSTARSERDTSFYGKASRGTKAIVEYVWRVYLVLTLIYSKRADNFDTTAFRSHVPVLRVGYSVVVENLHVHLLSIRPHTRYRNPRAKRGMVLAVK